MKRMALFILVILVLFTAELLTPVERHFVMPVTHGIAVISGAIVKIFTPATLVYGKVIQSADGFGVSIERGCNGIEAILLLTAGIVSFPASWRQKGVGLLAGAAAIQSLNVLRVVSLFYLGGWSRHAFEFFHAYIWQALIVLDALVVFLVWLRSIGKANDLRTPTHTEANPL